VRRIEWRIGNVQPAAPPFQCTFRVPGNPDSEYPGVWPFAAVVSLFALLVSTVLIRWARTLGSPMRRATFDRI